MSMVTEIHCPRCGATSADLRRKGFVVCAHCDALLHDGEALAEGGADSIRRAHRAMRSPDAIDAQMQEAQLDMMKGDTDGDLERWRRGMRTWLTIMPVTYPAYVPRWADDAASFARWVEESLDGAFLAKTDPAVASALRAVGEADVHGQDLLGSARALLASCRTLAREVHAATLREIPHARWLRERSEEDLARETFRTTPHHKALVLPRGALAQIFVEVLGDRRVAADQECSSCGGPREADDVACPWCDAVRVVEKDPGLVALQGLVDAMIERGEPDIAVAHAILSLQLSPIHGRHAVAHGETIIEAVSSVAAWIERETLLEAARGLSYMEEPRAMPGAAPRRRTKIGANEKCPCVSDKKYKRCCMLRETTH